MKTTKLFSATILAFLLLAGCGPKPEENRPDPVPTPTPPQEEMQTVTDNGGLYSLEVPKNWKIVKNEGAKGVQLSYIEAQTSDWKSHEDNNIDGPCTPQYYDAGADLTVHVTEGEDEPHHLITPMSTKNMTVDGAAAIYHVFKEPCTTLGQILDAHFNYNGNNYSFRLSYNPANYPQAETVFGKILSSVKLTKQSSKLTIQAVKNASYVIEGVKATLKDGSYTAPGLNGENIEIVEDTGIVFGDLDGDGDEDAALVLVMHTQDTTGFFYHLVAVANDNGKPKQVASYGIGDRNAVQTLSIINGKISISHLEHAPDDAACCPSLKSKYVFSLQGNKLVK